MRFRHNSSIFVICIRHPLAWRLRVRFYYSTMPSILPMSRSGRWCLAIGEETSIGARSHGEAGGKALIEARIARRLCHRKAWSYRVKNIHRPFQNHINFERPAQSWPLVFWNRSAQQIARAIIPLLFRHYPPRTVILPD